MSGLPPFLLFGFDGESPVIHAGEPKVEPTNASELIYRSEMVFLNPDGMFTRFYSITSQVNEVFLEHKTQKGWIGKFATPLGQQGGARYD
jgi:hypothetical protein